MAYISDYKYYLNEGNSPESINHGSYQYITMGDVINEYMYIYVGPDKMVDNVDRNIVRHHAKQAIKKLNYDSVKQVRAVENTITNTLKFVMPSDFVRLIRISLCKNGILYPMVENRTDFRVDSYLKDNSNELVFDNDGEVIFVDKRVDPSDDPQNSNIINDLYDYENYPRSIYTFGGRYGQESSQANANPRYRINRDTGTIDFASYMEGESVVLEYISDGMKNGVDADIKIHKFFEDYMYAYITYRILLSKTGIPIVARDDARKHMRAERNNAKIRMQKIDTNSMLMVLRGQHKWIK